MTIIVVLLYNVMYIIAINIFSRSNQNIANNSQIFSQNLKKNTTIVKLLENEKYINVIKKKY